jgi:hypothetical protein
MKKLCQLFFFVFVSIVGLQSTLGQSPNGFNYQAAIRNADGTIKSNESALMRFTIAADSMGTSVFYQETQVLTTDQYGLVSHVIGNGVAVIGTISGINWGLGDKYLRVEINTPVGYKLIGNDQLQSVPFALFANSTTPVTSGPWDENGSHIVNNNAGNVGIGTATPSHKLEVLGSLAATTFVLNRGGSNPTFKTGGTVGKGILFTTGENRKVLINANGNVGLGTETPSALIHLYGSGSLGAGSRIAFGDDYYGGSGVLNTFVAEAGWDSNTDSDRLQMHGKLGQYFTVNASSGVSATDTAITILANKNVGIGTTNPSDKLVVLGSDAPILFGHTSNPLTQAYLVSGSSYYGFKDGRGFTTFSIEQSNGNIGVGILNATEKLQVAGNIYSVSGDLITSSGNGVINCGGGILNATINMIADGNVTPSVVNGDEDLFIEDDLQVNSQAYKPGGGSWATTSDRRLKKDIRPYTDGLNELLDVNPVWFKYNELAQVSDKDKSYVGIIAQEMQEVAPYMIEEVAMFSKVEEDEDGNEVIVDPGEKYLTYDATALTYMLVNAVKEQQELITQLQERIRQLELKNQ